MSGENSTLRGRFMSRINWKQVRRENWPAKASWDTSTLMLSVCKRLRIYIYNIQYIYIYSIYTEVYLHIRFHYLLRDQNISPTRIPPWKKRSKLPLYIKLPVEEKSVASDVMKSWEASSLPFGVLNGRCTFFGAYTMSIMYIYRLSFRHIDIYITSNKTTIMRIGFQ